MTGQDPSKVGCYLSSTAGNCHIIYLGSGPFTSENLSAHSTPYRLTSAGARAHLMHDFTSTTNIDFLLSTNRHILSWPAGIRWEVARGGSFGVFAGGNRPGGFDWEGGNEVTWCNFSTAKRREANDFGLGGWLQPFETAFRKGIGWHW